MCAWGPARGPRKAKAMGKGDRRRSLKMKQRKRHRKHKARLARKRQAAAEARKAAAAIRAEDAATRSIGNKEALGGGDTTPGSAEPASGVATKEK